MTASRFNVDELADSAGTGPVNFPFGLSGSLSIPGNIRASEGAGTTTLTISDNPYQVFNLSASARIVKLPSSGVVKGALYTMVNPNPWQLQIQASDASAIIKSWGSGTVLAAKIATPVASTDWAIVDKRILFGATKTNYTPTFDAGVVNPVFLAWYIRTNFNQILTHMDVQYGAGSPASGTFSATTPLGLTISVSEYPLGSASPLGTATGFQSPNVIFGVSNWINSLQLGSLSTYNVTTFSTAGLHILQQPNLNPNDWVSIDATALYDELKEF